MNNRPIVVPGVITGAVLLAALVGFVKLPADSADAAGVATPTSDADISMCRSVLANAQTVDLDNELTTLGEAADKGPVDPTDLQRYQSVLGTVLNDLGTQITQPGPSKKVQAPFAETYAVGVRTYNGLATVTKADVAKLQAAWNDAKSACAAVDA